MEELSDKEKLLRIIKKAHKKRKITKVLEPKLSVEGIDSPLVAENILHTSYSGTKSIKVRESLRKIVNI